MNIDPKHLKQDTRETRLGDFVRSSDEERGAVYERVIPAAIDAQNGISDEDDALRFELADILRRTVNAIRGEPEPKHSWGWHDLPARAAAAIAMIDVLQRALAQSEEDRDAALTDAYAEGRKDEREEWERQAVWPHEATPAMREAYSKVILAGSELDGAMVWRAMYAASPPTEVTDWQLEQLFDAVYEYVEFGRDWRERARAILRASPQEPK